MLHIYIDRANIDCSYAINNLYKPIYLEIVERFEKIPVNKLGNTLHAYWLSSQKYGLYHDNRISTKISSLIKSPAIFNNLYPSLKINLFLNLLIYTSNARCQDTELIYFIYTSIQNILDTIPSSQFLTFALYFSRNNSTPIEF